MKDHTESIFRDAPVPKAVITNVIPSVISMIMVLVYNLADTFFIGQTGDPLMVAAVSLATPAFLIFMAIGFLFGIGGTSLISRMLGTGNKDVAKKISSFCFWTSGAIGVLAAILLIVFARPLSMAIGASEATIDYTLQYLRIVAFAIPFLIISNAFSQIIRSEGQPNVAMTGTIIGNVINIVLDPIMILLLGWNVAGAAIATVIGNLAAVIYYIHHLTSSKTMLSIRPRDYSAKSTIVKGVLAIGIPASINSILMSSANMVLNSFMSEYGDLVVAGLGVAMKINMIAVMLLVGIGTGIQPLLGYCFGAGNRERFVKVIRFSLLLITAVGCVMFVICYFGAGPLAKAFLDNDEAFAYAFSFSRIYILAAPIIGVLFVFMNTIQAMGAALPSMILSMSRQGIIYFPMVWILHALYNTPQALAMAQPITDALAALLAVVLFVFAYRKAFKALK